MSDFCAKMCVSELHPDEKSLGNLRCLTLTSLYIHLDAVSYTCGLSHLVEVLS